MTSQRNIEDNYLKINLPEHSIVIQKKKSIIERRILESIDSAFEESITSAFDLKTRIKKEFNIELADNQLDDVEATIDLSIKNFTLTAARSGGKTFGIIIGMSILCLDMPMKIGITAPKAEQATRMINTFKTEIVPKSDYIKSRVDWKNTTNTKITWKNGSTIEAFSGSFQSSEEGRHTDVICVDEAQNVADFSMSNMIAPMIGHSNIGKIIKLGVPRTKGHFYKSAQNPNGIYLSHDWLHCPRLHNRGTFEHKGVKYPVSVLDRMPLMKWQQYFPENPELWKDGDMTSEDFETQYEMKWILDSNTFLSERHLELLIGDFEFKGRETEEYYFGLDLAGGGNVKQGDDRDETVLSIGRLRDGVKQKVASYFFQGDSIDQLEDILALIHPKYGMWHCKFGLVDLGYNPMLTDALIKEGVICEGVMFGSRDKETGKNMKNVMYESFRFEVEAGRFKYPCKAQITRDKALNKAFQQWCIVEEKNGMGINKKIEVPANQGHDDACSADILLNFALMGKVENKKLMKEPYKFPNILQGVSVTTGIDRLQQKSDNPFQEGNDSPFGKGPLGF